MKLAFKLGSIPVFVHGSFFLFTILLGVGGQQGGAQMLVSVAEWTAVVFVGVLLHELGHAVAVRALGIAPRIDLVGLGGLTSWRERPDRPVGPWRRIGVSLAGPMVGIAIGSAALVYRRTSGVDNDVINYVIWVNLGWGVLNLLPILPMDGGNVLFQFLNLLTKGHGERPARIVSLVLAGGIGVVALVKGAQFPALLAAMFSFQNIQALRQGTVHEREAPLRERLDAGFRALDQGDAEAGVRAASEVLAHAGTMELRVDAIRLLAYGHLLRGAWGDLMRILESPAAAAIGDVEMEKFERAARELGRSEEAAQIAAVRAQRPAAQST